MVQCFFGMIIITSRVKTTAAIRIGIRKSFKIVSDNVVERWIHQPNSPCEPLAVELVSDDEDGQAFLSREFHPLTAKAIDLEMAIGTQ